MKDFSIFRDLLIAFALAAFTGYSSEIFADSRNHAQPRSYLELAATGKLSIVPYVWERKANGKHIVVIGTRHIRNARSPMYDRIDSIFKRVRPQLVLHESVAPPELNAMSREQAIQTGADLGYTIYVSRKYAATTRSGDAPLKEELLALLARYPAEDVLVFLTAQRLIGGTRKPNVNSIALEYPIFFENYLVENGFPQKQGFSDWNGFLKEYKRVIGRSFSQESWNPDFVNPTLNAGRLSELARTSDGVRDRYLLDSIKKALQEQNRVVVVFGGWHVLALEPQLNNLLPQ
jgi:hypothetical protein